MLLDWSLLGPAWLSAVCSMQTLLVRTRAFASLTMLIIEGREAKLIAAVQADLALLPHVICEFAGPGPLPQCISGGQEHHGTAV